MAKYEKETLFQSTLYNLFFSRCESLKVQIISLQHSLKIINMQANSIKRVTAAVPATSNLFMRIKTNESVLQLRRPRRQRILISTARAFVYYIEAAYYIMMHLPPRWISICVHTLAIMYIPDRRAVFMSAAHLENRA
jgi:ATP-dependent Zn protease